MKHRKMVLMGAPTRTKAFWKFGKNASPLQREYTNTVIYSAQFRVANLAVVRLQKETGILKGKPMGRTCKCHTKRTETGFKPPALEV